MFRPEVEIFADNSEWEWSSVTIISPACNSDSDKS